MVDILRFGVVNRDPMMSISVLVLVMLGIVMLAAKVSAPFIYSLF